MRVMSKKRLLYTQPGCAPCDQVKAFLIQLRVDFEVRDVSADAKALGELTELGYLATPVAVIDGAAVVGFNRKRLELLLQGG